MGAPVRGRASRAGAPLLSRGRYTRERPLRIDLHYPTDTDNRRTYEAVAAMWRANLGRRWKPITKSSRCSSMSAT